LNARNKGASGERELARWLHTNMKLDKLPERNLEQVRHGGSDLLVYPFFFECKRVECLDLRSWWIQVKTEAEKEDAIPVVAFRQNRKQWEFLISASHIGLDKSFVRLNHDVFLLWAANVLESV